MIDCEAPYTPKSGTVADFVFRSGPHAVFRILPEAGSILQMGTNIVAQDPNGLDGCPGSWTIFAWRANRPTLGPD